MNLGGKTLKISVNNKGGANVHCCHATVVMQGLRK